MTLLEVLAVCGAINVETRGRSFLLPIEFVIKEKYPSYRFAIPTAAYGDSDVALGAIPSALANAREMEWDDLKQGNADCNERFSYIWD